MSAATLALTEVVHRLPGRVRVSVPGLDAARCRAISDHLRALTGVRTVQCEPLTGKVLVEFSPQEIDEKAVIREIQAAPARKEVLPAGPQPNPAAQRQAELHHDHHAASVIFDQKVRRANRVLRRVRVAVRGLDRDRGLSQRIVARLSKYKGVRVEPSPLTGRVLIEFDEKFDGLRDILEDISTVELPPAPGEDNPMHPLDPAPLVRSSVRVAGAGLGLSILTGRRLLGAEGPLITNPSIGYVTGVVSIAQGLPAVRRGLRSVFGRDWGDLALSVPDLVLAAINSSPLALLANGAGAMRLLSTVVSRRDSWRRYEERISDSPIAEPGEVARIESGERTPLPGVVLEGNGTALGSDGLALHFGPGDELPAGARLRGNGPFMVELATTESFEPQERSEPEESSLYDRYQQLINPLSLGYAVLLGLITRSPGRAFEAMICLSPRAATAGAEFANLSAAARVTRAGLTVVGTRKGRHLALPSTVIIESARVLTDGLELEQVDMRATGVTQSEVLDIAARVSQAAGSPWGELFGSGLLRAENGEFDGRQAWASIHGTRFYLELDEERDDEHRCCGRQALRLLRQSRSGQVHLATLLMRPRIAPRIPELVSLCRRHDVELIVMPAGDARVAEHVAQRANLLMAPHGKTALELMRERQKVAKRVAFLADSVQAAEVFAECDLAVAINSGRSGRFPARADVLLPAVGDMIALIEAGVLRKKSIRDAVGFSMAGVGFGMVSSWFRSTGIVAASRAVHMATLATYGLTTARFQGGAQTESLASQLRDPQPEQRWGTRPMSDVFNSLDTRPEGLTRDEAKERRGDNAIIESKRAVHLRRLFKSLCQQLWSPMIGFLAAGAAFALFAGNPVEFGLIVATILANVVFGVWQENQMHNASESMDVYSPKFARVLRDGSEQTVPSKELVSGDVILLSHGDRVPADARLFEAIGLEIDEAALTGESLPVEKTANGETSGGRIVLEGTDVVVGSGKAIVIAVGRRTRIGTIGTALSRFEKISNPLSRRLSELLRQFLPVAAVGGAIAFGSGVLRGRPWMPELVLACTMALAAIPEGLPLLAGVAEVAASRRLHRRKAVLRRLSAVEALGRVDVACTDKTGTLTEGRLTLSIVANGERLAVIGDEPGGGLSEPMRQIVLAAALASPHPDSTGARSHQTDVAIAEGAERIGLHELMRARRDEEIPFEPTLPMHASRVGKLVAVKGAPEAVALLCDKLRTDDGDIHLDEAGREGLLRQAEQCAARGIRVLMVAIGNEATPLVDPESLTALGFVGIRDPLRTEVPEAVGRCRRAGVRVIMLTGDHPATARAIATDAGILDEGQEVLSGYELSGLTDAELAERLPHVAVVARVMPLDKVRIVEGLKALGHTVAMTGDGVNDAPALRLADVGFAMGKGGTEVARQVADVVLMDDDFSTLVEALIEGRGFWRNVRRALGLLLGGNIGELGLMAVPLALGLPAPLNARHILAMNLLTDGLPALAVALQEPAKRDLSTLAREGTTALARPLRVDVFRRGTSTLLPSVTAYLVALSMGLPDAQTVAFAATICCQLTQTLDSRNDGTRISGAMAGTMACSIGLLAVSLAVPFLRSALLLTVPSPAGWTLVALASVAAPLIARSLGTISASNVEPIPSGLAIVRA